MEWMPTKIKGMPEPAPFDKRDKGIEKEAYAKLAFKLSKCMKKVFVQPFPVPVEVKGFVTQAIERVFLVLVKHNLLLEEAEQIAESGQTVNPDHPLARVWRTAHRLRAWLMQKYQKKKNAAPEKSKDKKDKKK